MEAHFTVDSREIITRANRQVQTDVSLNLNAELNNAVVDLADKGNTKLAAEELRKRSEELKQNASLYSNPALQAQSDDLAEQAVKIEQLGINNTMRKTMRADSYQTMNQQSAR